MLPAGFRRVPRPVAANLSHEKRSYTDDCGRGVRITSRVAWLGCHPDRPSGRHYAAHRNINALATGIGGHIGDIAPVLLALPRCGELTAHKSLWKPRVTRVKSEVRSVQLAGHALGVAGCGAGQKHQSKFARITEISSTIG